MHRSLHRRKRSSCVIRCHFPFKKWMKSTIAFQNLSLWVASNCLEDERTLAHAHHQDDLMLLSFDGDHNTPASVNKTKVLKEKQKDYCFTLRFLPRCAD